jgi:hypothetical protein
MFFTPLDDIDFQQVETFCHTWSEGVRVEYKLEIAQVPKIVSSFANTFGGIYRCEGGYKDEDAHFPPRWNTSTTWN